jgi:hypothetical protein
VDNSLFGDVRLVPSATTGSYGNVMGSSYVTNGLVFNIDAEDLNSYPGIGNTWADLSGNNNNASLFNSPTFEINNRGSLKFVRANTTYGEFSGSVNNFATGTVEMWFQYNSVGDNTAAQIFARRNTNHGTFTFGKNANDTMFFNIRINSGATLAAISSPGVITPNWTLFTGTYDGSIHAMYLNAQLAVSNSAVSSLDTTGTLLYNFGRNTSAVNYANVNIAVIRLYNRALSSTEITQNYNALKSRFGL